MTASKRSSSQHISNIETENELVFGAKWSIAGVGLALTILAGCDSFLPKETPRYNTVAGERRLPALNGDFMGLSQQQPAPVPLAAPVPQVAVAAPAPMPAPVPQPPVNVAPMPAPAPIAAPAPVAAQEPAMIDQMTGWFSTDPTHTHPEPDFPELQPTPTPEEVVAVPAATFNNEPSLEAEIRALEQELVAAGHQQQALSAPMPEAYAPEPIEAPVETLAVTAPTPVLSAATPQVTAPVANGYMPPLLPPPPTAYERNANIYNPVLEAAVAAPQPAIDFTKQPLSEPAFIASGEPMRMAEQYAPAPQIEAWTPPVAATAQPAIIPMSPSVHTSNASAYAPSGLIPPDLSEEYSQGYLPSSRYRSRR